MLKVMKSVYIYVYASGTAYNGWAVMVEFFSTLGITVYRAGFGEGTGPILLADVRCIGTESSLLNCSHTKFYLQSCFHFVDVGVVCPPSKYCEVFYF